MEWKKRGSATNYEEYVVEKTGKTINDFCNIEQYYSINRLDEIANVFRQLSADKSKRLGIIGDYDADGIDALAILAHVCAAMGINYYLVIPRRISEGYGFSEKILNRISKTDVLLTVDNGITAIDTIAKAKAMGIYTIVVDHHIGGDVLPNADIIVDPVALPGSATYSYYCGAGLAFKLAELLFGTEHPLVKGLSVYAAVATIGDAVPLTGDNRRIVIRGMKELHGPYATKGMRTLAAGSKITPYSTAEDIAFNLTPAINAPGRLDDDGGKLALSAICCNSELADEKIEELIEINNRRKELVSDILKELDIEKMRKSDDKCVFYYNPNLPEGLAGLLAGYFSEHTGKPSVVLCKTSEGKIKGSCRNKEDNLNLKEILDACSEFFISYGGHKKAAALSLEEENLQAFYNRFNQMIPKVEVDDNVYYDFEIQAKDLISLSDTLDKMEPFGEGNPYPIVCIKRLKLGDMYGNTIVYVGEGKKHIRLSFKTFKAIGFNMAEKYNPNESYEYVDILGKVEKNYYGGKVYYQMRLIDFRKSK